MYTDCRVRKSQLQQGTERTWKEVNRAKGVSFCGVSNVTPMSRARERFSDRLPLLGSSRRLSLPITHLAVLIPNGPGLRMWLKCSLVMAPVSP